MQLKGFTLIEALVAVTILIIGVIGPLTIAVRGITDGFFARNQIAANYLAQEAVEMVLNKRTANIRYNYLQPWTGLSHCFNEACGVNNPTQPVFSFCSPSSECDLVFDKTVGYYVTAGAAQEPVGPVFRREINMKAVGSNPNDPEEIKVTITVTWLNLALLRSLTLNESLYRY